MLVHRRAFLKTVVGVALVAMPAGVGYRYRQRLGRWYEELGIDESSSPGTLSQRDFEVLTALFEAVSPQPAPPSEDLREFVDWRTSSVKGYYRKYRDSVAVVESKARKQFGRGFAALDGESTEKLLREILLARPSPPPRNVLERKMQTAKRALFFRGETSFKEAVFPDLLLFYWSSAAGWSSLGYRAHPGVPDPLRSYTQAPAA